MAKGKKNNGNAGGDNNNNSNDNNNGGDNNKGGKNDGGDKDGGGGGDYLNIVLKVDRHCNGCSQRIRKTLLSFPGVHVVSFEGETTVKIVAGKKVDAVKVAENLEKKMSRKVELISPKPPKKDDQKKDDQKKDDKKPKELPVTTVVLKIQYHCGGCGEKTYKAVSSYKGVYEVIIDKEKDLVTVKGKVDGKEMVESIKKKLKKPVEIVPEKKNQKDKKDGEGEKKQEENSNGGGGGGKGGQKVVMGDYCSMVPYYGDGYGYGYASVFGYGPVGMGHPAQVFSDENPNACSIM